MELSQGKGGLRSSPEEGTEVKRHPFRKAGLFGERNVAGDINTAQSWGEFVPPGGEDGPLAG